MSGFTVERVDELPKRQGRGQPWLEALNQVKEQPGEWFKIWEGKLSSAYSMTGSFKSGKRKLPEGNFEFAARSLGNKQGAIFACYLGPNGSTPKAEPAKAK